MGRDGRCPALCTHFISSVVTWRIIRSWYNSGRGSEIKMKSCYVLRLLVHHCDRLSSLSSTVEFSCPSFYVNSAFLHGCLPRTL